MNKKMLAVCWVGVALFVAGWPGAARARDMGKAAAMVNGVEIKIGEVELCFNIAREWMFGIGQAFRPSENHNLREIVLDYMIYAALVTEQARAKGISAQESEIDDILWKFQGHFSSMMEFKSFLEQFQTDEKRIRTQISNMIMTKAFINQQFAKELTITEDFAKQYYDANPALFMQPEMVRASHILIKFADENKSAAKAEALRKIKRVQARLQGGEAFADLARRYSDCPSKERGGDLGYLVKGDLQEARLGPVEDAIFSMTPGATSDPVETIWGLHLVYVVDKASARPFPFEVVKDELIANMRRDKMVSVVMTYGKELAEQAKIERYGLN